MPTQQGLQKELLFSCSQIGQWAVFLVKAFILEKEKARKKPFILQEPSNTIFLADILLLLPAIAQSATSCEYLNTYMHTYCWTISLQSTWGFSLSVHGLKTSVFFFKSSILSCTFRINWLRRIQGYRLLAWQKFSALLNLPFDIFSPVSAINSSINKLHGSTDHATQFILYVRYFQH